MASTYLIEAEYGYTGVDFKEFLKLWLEEVNFYLGEAKEGRAKHLFKVTGERKVIIIIEKNRADLDKMMFETPLMKKLGDQAKVTVTELLEYETFANNVNEIIADDKRHEINGVVKKEGGMYFWADFHVEYSGFTLTEALKIWSEEANAALGAKSAGVVVDLWKCVGVRRIPAVLNFDSLTALDKTTFMLPIMQKNGHNMDLRMKSLITFEEFAKNLGELLQ